MPHKDPAEKIPGNPSAGYAAHRLTQIGNRTIIGTVGNYRGGRTGLCRVNRACDAAQIDRIPLTCFDLIGVMHIDICTIDAIVDGSNCDCGNCSYAKSCMGQLIDRNFSALSLACM